MLAYDKRGLWRWLALTALMVQLVVASGHVHFDQGDHAAAAASACSLSSPLECLPLDHQHDHEDGDCEICKTLRVSSAFVLTSPPAISRSVEIDNALDPRRSVVAVATRGAHAFHARGPPAS